MNLKQRKQAWLDAGKIKSDNRHPGVIWDRFDKTLAWTYPYPISAAYHSIFETPYAHEQLACLSRAIVETLEFLTICAFCDIAYRWQPEDVEVGLAKKAQNAVVAPSLGDLDSFLREYLCCAARRHVRTIFADADTNHTFLKRCYGPGDIPSLIHIRNEIAHDFSKVIGRGPEYIRKGVKLFENALRNFEPLRLHRLLIPVPLSGSKEKISSQQMIGAFPGMIWAEAEGLFPKDAKKPSGVIFYRSPTDYVPLRPMIAFDICNCEECLGAKMVVAKVQWPKKANEKPNFCEIFSRHIIKNEKLEQDFREAVAALSRDYSFQGGRNNYHQGYFYRALAYNADFDVYNTLGDTLTIHTVDVQRIMSALPEENPMFLVDYHDQTPPISDDVFDLKVKDLTLITEGRHNAETAIFTEGFRSFSVGFKKALEFAEQRRLQFSMFEPGLMRPFDIDPSGELYFNCKGYYEINVHIPTEVFNFNMKFPDGARIRKDTVKLSYEGDIAKLDTISGPHVVAAAGRETISYSVKRPKVGRNMLLNFEYEHFPKPDLEGGLPWYWAAYLVYIALSKFPAKKWEMSGVSDHIRRRKCLKTKKWI